MKSVEKNISPRKNFLDENFAENFGSRVRENKNAAACLRAAASVRTCESRLFFFGDMDFYFGGDVAEDFDLHGEVAEGFQRVVELDLALVDLEALGFEGFGDVAVGDGAEELIVFAGLARELELDAVERRRTASRRRPCSVAVFFASAPRMRSSAFMLPVVASMASFFGSRKLRA